MGFLRNNKKRGRRNSDQGQAIANVKTKLRRVRSRQRDEQAENCYRTSERKLDHLPAELLQHIFILSENLSIPECSTNTYFKLCGGSDYLHYMMLDKLAVTYQGHKWLNIELTTRRFVTAELLSRVGIKRFYMHDDPGVDTTPCIIPELFEFKPDIGEKEKDMELVVYLLKNGCNANPHHDLVYNAVRKKDESLVKVFLSYDTQFDYRSVVKAMELKLWDLASFLLTKGGKSIQQSLDLWIHVNEKRDIEMFTFLRQSGITPPYHALV